MKVNDDIDRTIVLKDYVDTYDSWREHMRSFDWCLNTGQYGVVSEPGISDIDCCALIADGSASVASRANQSWLRSQTEKRRYLFDHEPMLVPLSGMALLPNVFFFNNLRWDCDEAHRPEVVSADMRHYLGLIWVLYCLPRGVRFTFKNKVRLRKALSMLKTLHISEHILQKLISPSNPGADPLIKTTKIRQMLVHEHIAAEINDFILIEECITSIANICAGLDVLGDRFGAIKERSIKVVSPYGTIVGSDKTILDLHHKKTIYNNISLHSNIVRLVFFGNCNNEYWQCLSQKYLAAQRGLYEIFTSEKVSYPLVRPFNVESNFWETDPILIS